MKCCDIHAGMIKKKIEIQREMLISDGGGGHEREWYTIAAPVARIKPLSGNESLVAMKLEARVSHEITMRYRRDFTAQDRIKFGERVFNVRSVIDVEEAHAWTVAMVEEGVAT
jgi:SPP1 family predicted phage head-tail adaptor